MNIKSEKILIIVVRMSDSTDFTNFTDFINKVDRVDKFSKATVSYTRQQLLL